MCDFDHSTVKFAPITKDKYCDIFCTKSFMPFVHIFECAFPLGNSIHTICISRWLETNHQCSQCRKPCNLYQINPIYFTEGTDDQSLIDKLEEKKQMEKDLLEIASKNGYVHSYQRMKECFIFIHKH